MKHPALAFAFYFILFAPTASFALPEVAIVTSEASNQQTRHPVQWGEHKVVENNQTRNQFLGKIILGKAKSGHMSTSPFCHIENENFIAYASKRLQTCTFSDTSNKSSVHFKVQLEFKSFELRTNELCKQYSISMKISNIEALNKSPGFLSLTCQKAELGLYITLDYSDHLSLRKSLLHEKLGKNQNFKVYTLVGTGKLSNTDDLKLNSFTLYDKSSNAEVTQVAIQRESYLLIRQSPFEVDLGAAINQVSYSGLDGSFSTIAIRAHSALGYRFWGNTLVKFVGIADIYGLNDSSEEDGSTSYFFYETQQLLGYRFGKDHQIDAFLGLSFAKYAYKIDVTQRTFSRRGFVGSVLYKRVHKNQTDYWIRGEMRSFTGGDSAMSFAFGYRWSRSSKITPWIGLDQVTLSNVTSESTQSDSGQVINIGASLDF